MASSRRYFHIRNIDGKKRNFAAFKILENDGNGDCLFLSMQQFLKHSKIYRVPSDVIDLRRKIVNYISHSSNWNRFVDTIIFNLENHLPILQNERYTDLFKAKTYRNYMHQQYQYGTSAELQAASEIFDFVYVVFREEKRIDGTWYNCYSSEDLCLKPKMFLLFSGSTSSGHFQFMKPITPENICLLPQGEYKATDEYYASDDTLILSVRKLTD